MTSATQTEPDTTQVEGETEEQKADRAAKLRQAYSVATTRLREDNREEFDRLYQQEASARGVDYTPRLTAEQKAEQQLAALLAEHPHLRERIAPAAQ